MSACRSLVHVVSSLRVGGMEQFVLRVAAAQREAGDRVTILALQAGGDLEAQAAEHGISVQTLHGNKIARVMQTGALFARLRPEIVHAHNPTTLHYALLGKRFCGAKVVVTCHGRGKGDTRLPSTAEWERADAVVGCSQAVAGEMRGAVGRTPLHVILNGITPTPPQRSRAEVRAELGLTDEVTGIVVARIDHLKGHDTLLQALAALRVFGTAPVLLIVGDGAERAARETLARELRLSETQVRFLGFRSDVADLLAASDFFVLPSLTEGLPLSVLEAMAQRLPVVASAVGGIPELVTDGQEGLLVPPSDVDALTNALGRVTSDAALRDRFGAAGLTRVRSEFTFTEMLARYAALYESLMS